MKWKSNLIFWDMGWISSIKLIKLIRDNPSINHGYSKLLVMKKANAPRKKMIPPPRKVIWEWELRSLGLSIMLNLSAILK